MVSPVINMWNTEKQSGVSGIPTQLLVLHSAECPLRGGFAQSLTQWASVPLAQGGPEASWHRFVDPIARVRMINDNYAAWHASEANPMSIGWEQAGYARFTRAEWLTPEGLKQLDNLAYDMAEVAKRDGIPPVWLTNAQVRSILDSGNRSLKGFCTHRQIDPETRTDPGNGYPYDLLIAKVKTYLGSLAPASGTTTPAKPAPATGSDFMAKLTEGQQENMYKMIEVLYRDNVQGIPGVRPDGDSFNLLRRLAAHFGIKPDETARQTKYGKK